MGSRGLSWPLCPFCTACPFCCVAVSAAVPFVLSGMVAEEGLVSALGGGASVRKYVKSARSIRADKNEQEGERRWGTDKGVVL